MNQLRLDFGQAMVKIARRYTRCHIKVERENAHLYFNHRCKEEKLVPAALKVKPLFNTTKARSLARKQTRQNLNLRISNNHEVINKELKMMVRLGSLIMRKSSQEILEDITIKAKEAATREAQQIRARHQRKLLKLRNKRDLGNYTVNNNTLNNYTHGSCDKSNWIVNLSDRQFNAEEIKVLQRGLNFAVAPNKIPISKILSEVEVGIKNLGKSEKDLVRAQVCNITKHFTKIETNISLQEKKALTSLKNDPSVIILKADKGNCTVVINTCEYNDKMEELLSDTSTYYEIKKDSVKKTERSMNAKLLNLKRKGKFEDSEYYRIRSTDGVIPRIYGLVKIHKDNYPLRPIVSMIGSPLYNVSKFLANIISPLVGNSPYIFGQL